MKLQEKHKEFAVTCYARFMTRTEVVEAFIEEFADDLPEPLPLAEIEQSYKPTDNLAEDKRKHLANHQNVVKNHNKKVKRNLSNQLRRFNITHRQFPDKYCTLFDQIRMEYFSSYRSESLENTDDVALELETLYGYVKQRIFNEANPKEIMNHVNLAHKILRTIVTCHAISAKDGVIDVTPEKKALQDRKKLGN